MTALSPKEAADDSVRGFALAIATLREQAIRSGSVLPSPDRPDEQRWAVEGPRPVRELDTVRRSA